MFRHPIAGARPRPRRPRLAHIGLVALPLLVACAAKPVPPPPPPVPEPEPPPAPVEVPSIWRAVPVPPDGPRPGEPPNVDDGNLVIDATGARWLFPLDETPPRPVEAIELAPIASREADGGLGYKLTLRDGRVLATRRGLDPFVEVARLPDDAVPRSARFFEGITTVRTAAGLARATDGHRFEAVPSLPGRDPVEAIFDAKGRGVGLFAPETVAVTRDAGATWTVIPLAGVDARSLRVAEGKIVIEPGGTRDRFRRAVDLETGATSRVALPSPRRPNVVERRVRITPSSKLAGLAGEAAPAKPVRLELESDFYLGASIARDGDRVLSWRPAWGPRGRTTGLFLGTVGEGTLPYAPQGAKDCTVVDASVCGDRVALACEDGIRVFGGQEQIASFPHVLRLTVAFDSPDSLVALERQADRTGQRELLRYTLGEKPREETAQKVSSLEGEVALRGGCHKPALWAVGRTEAAKVERAGLSATSPIPSGGGAVGIRDDGQLVTVSDKLLFFLPSADTVKLLNRPDDRVSFAEDGRHGLLVERSGVMRQTDDGGLTWEPIAAPTMTTAQRVLCGATRCQLGAGAVRTGFVKDPSFVPRAEEQTPEGSSWATLPPNTVYPTALVCKPDAALFQGIELAPDGVAARTGSLLFAGLGPEDGDEGAGGTIRPAIFGDLAGKAVTSPLPVSAPATSPRRGRGRSFNYGPDNNLILMGGVGIASGSARGRSGDVTTTYRWEPGGPLVRRLDKGSWGSPLASPSLLGDERVADVSMRGTLLTWNRDRVAAYPFPNGWGANRGGMIAVEGDDARVAVEVDETQVRLVLFHRDDPARERTFLVRRKGVREAALGLVEGPRPALVLTEITEDGGTELRIRPIEADLSLGDATAVPGTRTAADHLMRLPSCGASPRGTLVRAVTTAKVAATIDAGRHPRGYLQRYLRVTPTAACVERTALADTAISLRGNVVVAGDGGIGAAAGKGAGLRCEPVVTTPLPRPFVPTEKPAKP